MKPRVVTNSLIAKMLRVQAITLYPFILINEPWSRPSPKLLKHEMVHYWQVVHHGWFRFYLSYIFYYWGGRLRYKNHEQAYYDIPYELAAYTQQEGPLTKEEQTLLKRWL